MHSISQFIGTINASDRPRAKNINRKALKLHSGDICSAGSKHWNKAPRSENREDFRGAPGLKSPSAGTSGERLCHAPSCAPTCEYTAPGTGDVSAGWELQGRSQGGVEHGARKLGA